MTIQQSDDYAAFWQILQGNLQARYGVRPVHTLDEMLLLKSRFPDNIQLYTAQLDGRVIGGTVLYLTGKVLHTQYISSTSEGKHLGAVDALFDCILNKDYANYPIFDFGKSTEGDASTLNESLIYQKKALEGVACVTTPMSGVCDMRHKGKSSWRRYKSMVGGGSPQQSSQQSSQHSPHRVYCNDKCAL